MQSKEMCVTTLLRSAICPKEWKRQKEREREKERQRDIERERHRQVKADLEQSDSDDDRPPWERRSSCRNSRQKEDRRLKRKQEEEVDKDIEELEQKEIEAKRRRQVELEQDQALDATQNIGPGAHGEGNGVADEGQEGAKAGPEVDPNDPIMKAMMAAMAAPSTDPPPAMPTAATAMDAPSHRPPETVQPLVSQPHPAPQANSALADMFGDDEDDQPQRQLRLLNYSEDELAGSSGSPADDPKAAVKRLMDNIPTSRDGVFAYPIKWDVYSPNVLGANITKWVDRKISDLLGENEPTLVSFVMGKLGSNTSPRDLLSQLSEVLDDEAEVFIVKLYRMVIYETEKLAAGF